MKNNIKYILLLVVLTSSASFKAYATNVTAPLLVSATVLSVCGVAATPLLFGNYSTTNTSPTTATASVTAICTSGVNYTLALDGGIGSGGTVAMRIMTNPLTSTTLKYTLYSDSGYTTLWGDGTLSTSKVSGTSNILPQVFTVYGSIPAGQQSVAGAYADTVTVTLAY